MSSRVLVTGANGFVGKALCELLVDNEMSVKGAIRRDVGISVWNDRVDLISVGDIDAHTDWIPALKNVDCIVHLAARVHVMSETASSPLDEFRRVNTLGTEKLARDAATAGVKRLVYLSSIKVNGEETCGTPFNEHVDHAPVDPYGLSKWEAENSLRQISSETGMEVVIIRPPLVYGPGVKGNFLTLLKCVSKGFPLPLANVKNKRSLVALTNLVDLISECVVNPRAAGETFLVSDGKDLSTADLIKTIALAMEKPPRLISVPLPLLNIGAATVGKKGVARRLLASLQIDSSKACQILGWSPPCSIEHEIEQVVGWFRREY